MAVHVGIDFGTTNTALALAVANFRTCYNPDASFNPWPEGDLR
jgi:molecular chaperone DnaK (HSP70)